MSDKYYYRSTLVLRGVLALHDASNGGRQSPIANGYRPTIAGSITHLETEVIFDNAKLLTPGSEEVCNLNVFLHFTPSKEPIPLAPIRVGLNLPLHEGARKIANFEILKLIEFRIDRLA